MLIGDSDPATRRAWAARVTALADHCETTLLGVQAFCQEEGLRYTTETAAVPRVLKRAAADIQDGRRPDRPLGRWWRRW